MYGAAAGKKEDIRLWLLGDWIPPDKAKPVIDTRPWPDKAKPPIYTGWQKSYNLYLRRIVDANGTTLYIDRQTIDPTMVPADSRLYFERDVRRWHVVYQVDFSRDGPSLGSLGRRNDIGRAGHNFSFFLPNQPGTDDRFITVGDITRILTIGHGTELNSTIGQKLEQTSQDAEQTIRLDLQNPYHRNIFQYLTVFDPTSDGIDNDGDGPVDEGDRSEWKIPGRININTAPWYVIAQLPWVSLRPNEPANYRLARAIVAYRDKLKAPVDYSTGRYEAIEEIIGPGLFDPSAIREALGFESIGELNFCLAGSDIFCSMDYYILGSELGDLPGLPDLTTDETDTGDGIADDFEERDIIFSRISNLTTVRSDVFTAYILVRIGADGPQKRALAILDRSNVYTANGKVKIVALHNVPDPR